MEAGGFEVWSPEQGKWMASHEDAATGATTWVTFPDGPEVTQVNIIFLTYKAGVDYTDAFWIPLCTILGLFPDELHGEVMDVVMVTIPTLQAATPDGSALIRVGDFSFKGGFFASNSGPDGSPCLMLDITTATN